LGIPECRIDGRVWVDGFVGELGSGTFKGSEWCYSQIVPGPGRILPAAHHWMLEGHENVRYINVGMWRL